MCTGGDFRIELTVSLDGELVEEVDPLAELKVETVVVEAAATVGNVKLSTIKIARATTINL
ncbi:MAG: hypothetical protein JRN15_13715 [Nitrososphaerota archaeon]|nr:hypothetical protein [Nitrososphaerota archaeon]